MQVFITILIPLLAAVWVYVDVKEKGRSDGQAFLWAFGTFMALIVFLPLWLFVRWRDKQAKTVRYCSSCRHPLKDAPGAPYCPYCGKRLDSPDDSQSIDIEYHKQD